MIETLQYDYPETNLRTNVGVFVGIRYNNNDTVKLIVHLKVSGARLYDVAVCLQVAPAYLEDVIVKHSGVADVAVIGVPDDDAGELPKAYVVRQTGSTITANELSQHVKGTCFFSHRWIMYL